MANYAPGYAPAYYDYSSVQAQPGGGQGGSGELEYTSGYQQQNNANVGQIQHGPTAGFDESGFDEMYPRTVYVGNLEPSVSEDFMSALFGQIGTVLKCKIIHETGNEPYAFVEYESHESAAQALTAMNRRVLLGKSTMMLSPVPSLATLPTAISATQYVNPAALTGTPITTALQPATATMTAFEGVPIFLVPAGGAPAISLSLLQKAQQEMKVNWATQPGNAVRVDTSKHFHIFVGDLSLEVDNKALKDAFAPFGDISDAKVIRDLQTLKSKGYGFVSFVNKDDAERAIEQMNGQWLGRRTIRTNWATRKPASAGSKLKTLSFDEVYNQSAPNNCTVYVGGIPENATEDDLRKVFAKFGTIVEIRIFKNQGYSFIRYDNKESATHAIVNLNGTDINGSTVRCSWGRQGDGSTGGLGQAGYGYGYGYGGGAGPAAAAAAQYWQQYYSQYYNNPAMMQQWQSYWQNAGGQ